MKPVQIEGHTRVLAEGQDEYEALHVRDIVLDGARCMVSEWEPSQEQRDAIASGANIRLHVLGSSHPPVMLSMSGPVARSVEVSPRVEEALFTLIDFLSEQPGAAITMAHREKLSAILTDDRPEISDDKKETNT